jgi:hypothetical protein
MKRLRQLSLATALSLAFLPTTAMTQEVLFELGSRTAAPGSSESLIARYSTRLNLDVLEPGEAAELHLELPDMPVVARVLPASPKNLALDRDQAAWAGPVTSADSDRREGEIFIMRRGDYLQARIVYRGRLFSLRTIEGAGAVLEEHAPRDDHPEGTILPVPEPRARFDKPQRDSLCEDPPDQIDIMVVYTEAARDAAGGAMQIENEIGFAVSQANYALANSNAYHRMNLVRIEEVNYDEATSSTDFDDVLDYLQDDSDMIMDPVHGWRDDSKADLVALVTEDGDCGLAYVIEDADADTTDEYAFSVFDRSCLNTNISLAHETGHNLGARHNREDSDPSTLPDDYNYGHRQPNPTDDTIAGWRTVMSYSCDGTSCGRVTQFSDPDVDYPSTNGDPTGVPVGQPDPEDNVMMFEVNDADTAKYRCSRTEEEVANVWGKDTWADTGLEPDPATAGEPMWRSPYIWVRNSEDVNDEFHHVHENPNISGDAHVYVKMLNDGNLAEMGNLELYFADASTQLNSPANWTQIDTQAFNFTTATEVFEFEWNGLPGTGHYCLMARWNNDGSALSFSSIDAYVRNDGGAIWRNVNIEGMGGDTAGDEPLIVRGVRGLEEAWLRIVTRPNFDRDIPWIEAVKTTLTVDPGLLPSNPVAIGLSGANGVYNVPLDSRVKFLGPLKLGPKDETKATMTFDPNQGLIEELRAKFGLLPHYFVSVQQVTADAVKVLAVEDPAKPFQPDLVLGGVDYTLTLEKPQ